MKTRDIFYRTNKAGNEISESGLRLILALVILEILSGSSASRGAHFDNQNRWLELTPRVLFTHIKI